MGSQTRPSSPVGAAHESLGKHLMPGDLSLGSSDHVFGKHLMPGDLSLGSIDHVSVTNRTARKPSAKGRRGYHRAVTPEIAAELCRRIASGRTLLAVCRDSDMPHPDAIYDE